MTYLLGPVDGWYLICGVCGEHKPLRTDRCRCGARVEARWIVEEPTSPELVLVARSLR